MFRQIHVRSVWMATLIVPGLLWVASGSASAKSPSSCAAAQSFTAASFPSIPKVNNKYLPWSPGMHFVLDGFVTGDDGLTHPHRIETTVTDLTKVIDGVRTIVVFDVDIQDGQVVESEVFFQAQSTDGSVWNLGEYPEEYENGSLAGAPSTWISDLAGAKAGIGMLARPTLGSPYYLQAAALSVGFLDCAGVFATGQRTCVPVRCFDDVLVTDEFAPRDPAGGHQRKFYAPGVGTVRVSAADGVDPEFLELTKLTKLCRRQLANIRTMVLQQDSRGYIVSPHVYGKTQPMEATLTVPGC